MSEDSVEKIPSNSIAQTRKQIEKKVNATFTEMSLQERQAEIERETLESLNPNQLSIEFLTNFVRVQEECLREKANKDLVDYEGSLWAESSFNTWSELHAALKGAKGEGPVSATIDYFRGQASIQREIAQMIVRQLSSKDSISINSFRSPELFEFINKKSLSIPKFEKAAENYDTAARLFENKVNFKVSATETPPTA